MDNVDKLPSRGLKINTIDTSVPTTQIDLNNTVGVTLSVPKESLYPVDSNISIRNGKNINSTSQLASIKSVNSLRNLYNQFDSTRNNTIKNASISYVSTRTHFDKVTHSGYSDDSFQSENNNTFTNVDNTRDSMQSNVDDINDTNHLANLLQESIFSYAPSINGSYNRSIVGNEIPDIFKADSDNDSLNNDQSIITSSLDIHNVDNNTNLDDDISNVEINKFDKNFFILSNAGKPIYAQFGKEQQITILSGIINTIINFFQLNEDENIRCIQMGPQFGKIVFLHKDQIILMAYSRRNETKFNLQNQLEFLYSYILSSLTSKQLNMLFNKRSNFDLRTFLNDSHFENLNEICNIISNRLYPDILINALPSQYMKKNVRRKIHSLILDCLNIDSYAIPRGTILYGLLLSHEQTKLISVLRPKGHTLHTNDLQLLFCLIRHHLRKQRDSDTTEANSQKNELWLPICFPKFNSTGFLYSYIKFIPDENNTCIVLISAQKDAFFKLKLFADRLWNKIIQKKLDKYINNSLNSGFKMRDISAPLIHHFIYKSKRHVQYVMPELEFNINSEENLLKQSHYEAKLQKYYKQLYDSVIMDDGDALSKTILNIIHWKSAQTDNNEYDNLNRMISQNHNQNNYNFFLNDKIDLMGLVWMTPNFELYLLTNNGVYSKDVIMRSAKKILRWCKYNESRLFIDQGAIF